MSNKKNRSLFMLWLLLSLALASYLAYGLWGQPQVDEIYLPDTGSHGHYQIELACDACHGDGFADEDEMQSVCTDCHGDELKQADDSHPIKKFTDPRNAERAEILDARYCITCHAEHVPDRTRVMGVTLADDFCVLCHQEVGDERASHKDLSFDGCSAAGCHNYHDNRALYEDYLVKHAEGDDTKMPAQLAVRDYQKVYQKPYSAALDASQMDGGKNGTDPKVVNNWAASAHATAGINCSGCHQAPWQEKPLMEICSECHQGEVDGFSEGRHGMRLAQQLSAMATADARQMMKPEVENKTLSCGSCHQVHAAETQYAAVQACQSCHDDQHSNNYQQSPHYTLWQQQLSGEGKANSGVSCASCHLPRVIEGGVVRVEHNQNHNLRPNEKMIRDVCMECHSLRFSIDALADSELIKNNFNGQPSQHVESIDWAVDRVR